MWCHWNLWIWFFFKGLTLSPIIVLALLCVRVVHSDYRYSCIGAGCHSLNKLYTFSYSLPWKHTHEVLSYWGEDPQSEPCMTVSPLIVINNVRCFNRPDIINCYIFLYLVFPRPFLGIVDRRHDSKSMHIIAQLQKHYTKLWLRQITKMVKHIAGNFCGMKTSWKSNFHSLNFMEAWKIFPKDLQS